MDSRALLESLLLHADAQEHLGEETEELYCKVSQLWLNYVHASSPFHLGRETVDQLLFAWLL